MFTLGDGGRLTRDGRNIGRHKRGPFLGTGKTSGLNRDGVIGGGGADRGRADKELLELGSDGHQVWADTLRTVGARGVNAENGLGSCQGAQQERQGHDPETAEWERGGHDAGSGRGRRTAKMNECGGQCPKALVEGLTSW